MNETSYVAARRALLIRRLSFFAVAGLLLLFPYARQSLGADATGAVLLVWFGLFTLVMLRWFMFVCPRCNSRFFHKPGSNPRQQRRNYYANVCADCGLDLRKG